MTDPSRAHDVTGLLLSWGQGDAAALDRLVPLVYDELRRVARGHLRRERSRTRPPGDGARARGLPATRGRGSHDAEEPDALLCGVGPADAPDPRRPRPSTAGRQARRRRHRDQPGRGGWQRPLQRRPAWTCSPSTRRSMRCLRSMPGSAASWSCDSSPGSTSPRRPTRSVYRRPRSSANGPWQRPGSTSDCRRREGPRPVRIHGT